MKSLVKNLSLSILLFGLVHSHANANTVDKLQREGHLKVEYRIESIESIVQYQPVIMEIEVATDRWFSRGSRIEAFEITDAVVYRASQLSTNSTRTEEDKTWAVQLWTLVFYPQKNGPLNIPAIDVFVSANTEGNKTVEGTLSLAARSIDISAPTEMKDIPNWVATSQFTVSENYQGLAQSYRPGDAIVRTITLQIEAAPAMMLPAIEAPSIKGLGVYSVQPKIAESSNRGQLTGRREQQFIYTIEGAGSYTLPEYTFYWWDLNSAQKRRITLPAFSFTTESTDGEKTSADTDQASRLNRLSIAIYSGGFLSVALLAFLLYKKQSLQPSGIARRQQKQLARLFLKALEQGNATLALQQLYRAMEQYPSHTATATLEAAFDDAPHCLQLIRQLQQCCYGQDDCSLLTLAEGQLLINHLSKTPAKPLPWKRPVELDLNPSGQTH